MLLNSPFCRGLRYIRFRCNQFSSEARVKLELKNIISAYDLGILNSQADCTV